MRYKEFIIANNLIQKYMNTGYKGIILGSILLFVKDNFSMLVLL